MKKILSITSVMAALAISANAAVIYDLNFDSVTAGAVSDGTVLTNSEVGTVPNPVSDVITARAFSGADGPSFGAATDVAIPAFSATQALLLDSGGQSEGITVEQADGAYLGDATIEVQCLINFVSGNTVDLFTPFSTEWPAGATMQIMFRIHGAALGDGGMRFHTDRGDSNGEFVEVGAAYGYGAWHHVAGTVDYDAVSPELSQIELFIDGSSIGTSAYDATANSFTIGSTSSLPLSAFAVGFNLAQFASASDNRGMDGAVDAVVISDSVLGTGTFVLGTTPGVSVPVELSVFSAE